jgi:hypothetical protein
MVKLNADNLNTFIELLKEEHTINNNIIPTIYEILLDATGYVHEEVPIEKNILSKKEQNILRSKRRAAKEKSNIYT